MISRSKHRIRLVALALALFCTKTIAEELVCPSEPKFEPMLIQCKTPGIVALTFDDGPHGNTPAILNILQAHNVKATFFVVGSRLQKSLYANYLLDTLAQGHVVGNHTWSHPDLTTLSVANVELELKKTDDIVMNIANYKMRYMRPPHGKITAKSAIPAWDADQTIGLWNLDSLDYKPVYEVSAAQELANIKNAFANSSPTNNSFIILLHDYSAQTLENLPAIIDAARERGYTLGTLDDCKAKISQ